MDVIPGLLRSATKSILIEQQYIKSDQDHITALLEAIRAAKRENPRLDVRIVLGKIFSASDLPKERRNLDNLKDTYGLKLGLNIRYIDATRLVHCHNKMVIVDGKGVLVSSQNWSKAAVSENREAGVWLEHAAIAKYFTGIFETDWKTAIKTLPPAPPDVLPPSALRAEFIRVDPGDYQEV
jgi:phosphatidylserine/phosphatidylglycerophosphate/cardiolipin synthase-like enzyme